MEPHVPFVEGEVDGFLRPLLCLDLVADGGGLFKALWFALIILIVQQIDGNILAPLILGDKVGNAFGDGLKLK